MIVFTISNKKDSHQVKTLSTCKKQGMEIMCVMVIANEKEGDFNSSLEI